MGKKETESRVKKKSIIKYINSKKKIKRTIEKV